uniref:Uncharacterized protein n=1 Tax=Aegilops tauschii subsp. strangulata TaxID=200361 RepID=A0A453M2Z4_AEGTS
AGSRSAGTSSEDLRLDVNQLNCQGHTPLYLSAYFGRAAAARYLLDHGADPLASKLRSPLYGAAMHGLSLYQQASMLLLYHMCQCIYIVNLFFALESHITG